MSGHETLEVLPRDPTINHHCVTGSVCQYFCTLEGPDHEVLEASNGRRGLALYREISADLIITDIVMSEMGGLEMLLELTRNFLNVEVIAMSDGLEGEGMLDVAKLLGARQTFQKPLDSPWFTIRRSASSQSSRSCPSSRPRCSYSTYAKAATLV